MTDRTVYRYTPGRSGEPATVTVVEDNPWPTQARYSQFQSVDLWDGATGVVLDPWRGAEPMAYVVEVFLAGGSCGDGVIDMVETEDGGLVPIVPEELAAIKR